MKSAQCCTEVEPACTEVVEKPLSLNSADGAALVETLHHCCTDDYKCKTSATLMAAGTGTI